MSQAKNRAATMAAKPAPGEAQNAKPESRTKALPTYIDVEQKR